MSVEYDYVGNDFFGSGVTGGGIYTDSDRVTGFVILSSALPAGATSNPDILAYGFSDGHDTILSSDHATPMLAGGQFTTNAAGQIVSAYIGAMENIGTPFSGDDENIQVTPDGDSAIYGNGAENGVAGSGEPGTWTLAGLAPAPSTAPAPTFSGAGTGPSYSDNGVSEALTGDNGNDTFLASTGNDTITTGSGTNLIAPGSGNDVITANGSDVILPETGGSEVIYAFGPVLAAVGSGTMFFVNGDNPSTVIGGGGGSAVIAAGNGGGLYAGGTGGTNFILGGAGACTMFGSAGSDLLAAGGANANLLIAGSGNETLSGIGSTGANVMYAGSGNDLLGGGAGAETFFAGSGHATVIGGSGADLYAFGNGLGGTETIFGFDAAKGDRIDLVGFGAGEASSDLAGAAVSGAGTTLTLSDHTQVTFAGVTGLNSSAFV